MPGIQHAIINSVAAILGPVREHPTMRCFGISMHTHYSHLANGNMLVIIMVWLVCINPCTYFTTEVQKNNFYQFKWVVRLTVWDMLVSNVGQKMKMKLKLLSVLQLGAYM